MLIFFDTEYNNTRPLLLCAVGGDNAWSFDLREQEGKDQLKVWIEECISKEDILVSYALAAEITQLCRLGIETDGLKTIDLMAECRMVTMSHHDYYCPDGSLLSHLRVILGVGDKTTKEHKEKMRDLIITQNSWNDNEWDEIEKYCVSDIIYLELLLKRVSEIHKENNHTLKLSVALGRGEYVRVCAVMDHYSLGFPVYGGKLETLYSNKDNVKKDIIQSLPIVWRNCFTPKKGSGFTLSRKRVLEVIKANNWDWKMTNNNLPCLDADYLKSTAVRIPSVESLRQALKSLVTLNSSDLREQVVDGYIKPRTFSFSAKTGRNGLKPKLGYLLNLPAWMRKVIKPHPDMVMIGSDWSQQEIAIAAALSGDADLIEAYASGDVYLSLGKLAGMIPEDGTKKTHKVERDLFKALQLALGYGKGVKSLGIDFYGIMQADKTLNECLVLAKEIYTWHKANFTTYWEWVDNEVAQARLNGWIETKDGWVEWVGKRTATTQLLNFPSQSGGAAMMRLATLEFYKLWKEGKIPPVLVSQHDAFYFNCDDKDHTGVVGILESVMSQVGQDLFGILVRCGTKIYTSSDGYQPEFLNIGQEKLWEIATSA